MPPQDTRLQRFGMPRMCPVPHFATALLELARPAPVFPDHRLDTTEVSWSTVAPLAPAIPITAQGAHIFEPAPAGAAPATNLPPADKAQSVHSPRLHSPETPSTRSVAACARTVCRSDSPHSLATHTTNSSLDRPTRSQVRDGPE